MPIVGHGVDLVEVARIGELIERHGDHLLERCFTTGEREYAFASSKRRDEHLAARFAAKEAALKALGTGWTKGIGWTDVEVVSEPSGRPRLLLHGRAAEIASTQGINAWHVSLSHTSSHAMASVVAERVPPVVDS